MIPIISSIRSTIQVALIGAVTENLRAVNVQFDPENINIYFYYDKPFSTNEEELSEIVGTEVISSFTESSLNIKRIILPYPSKIPIEGIRVYGRFEPTPPLQH